MQVPSSWTFMMGLKPVPTESNPKPTPLHYQDTIHFILGGYTLLDKSHDIDIRNFPYSKYSNVHLLLAAVGEGFDSVLTIST